MDLIDTTTLDEPLSLTAGRWPLDYDALSKGDMIPVSRLEEITGLKQGDAKFQFAVLRLIDRIQRELHDRGRPWTLRTERGAIKILTDAEAFAYNHEEQVRHRRAVIRRHGLQSAVDVAKLTDEQRREHERNVEIDGRYVQAQLGIRKQLQIEVCKRNVPGLPEK